MKFVFFGYFILAAVAARSQQDSSSGNIFIITTDGLRWQEVFKGADSSLIDDTQFVQDPDLIKQQYWDSATDRRREKLMPFFWNTVAKKGQLYGNRDYQNKVDVANI